MNPLHREALVWIGGAVLVALLILTWVAFSAPLDDLASRYSVL